MARFQNILGTIGHTPVVRINRLAPDGINLYVKIEAFNPLGSVKDRLALAVVEAAEQSGELKPGQTVVEATSGNTGIGLAMVCAAKGYPLVITMAESFSIERRRLMRFLGAKVVVTPAAERAVGMIKKTVELAEAHGWFMTRQFENEANPDFHSRTTAREIIDDFAGERLDFWVTGYGTGGTLKGVGRVLRKERPETKIIVCEPADAPLLESGIEQKRLADGSPAAPHPSFKPHPMQGWTPDFIPKLTGDAVDMKLIDRVLPISGRRRHSLQQGARGERRHFRRHNLGRNLCRGAEDRGGGAERREHSLHASRHRRAISQHTPVRRHPCRHDRGGACHLAVRPRCATRRLSSALSLRQLDRHCGCFAAADAERRDAALCPARPKRGDQRHQNARARGADRMAERAGAAVDVDLLVRQPEVAHRRHGDDGEGLVDLEQIDEVLAPPGLLEQLFQRPDRGGGKIFRRGGMRRMRKTRARGAGPRFSASLARIMMSAAAPSEIELELAAVTVPPSRNAGLSVAILSGFAFGGCSSVATSVSDLPAFTVTGAISQAKSPFAIARLARSSELTA